MDPQRLDTTTNVYPQIITSNLSYKSPVKLDQTLDFVITIDTPKLDIYFSNQEDLDVAIISEQFQNTLFTTTSTSTGTINASILQSSDSNQLKIGNIIIEYENINHSLISHYSIPILLEAAIYDGISSKIQRDSRIEYNINHIISNIITNISSQSATIITKSYGNGEQETNSLVDYWTYAHGPFSGHMLHNETDLFITYNLPIRLASNPTHSALQSTENNIINVYFGIKYSLFTSKIKYYDPISIQNDIYD